jgi:monothiol glutaredoxin
MERFHADVVAEVAAAVARDAVVVVGMGWNPFVKRARKAMSQANIPHTYLEYGNYLSAWRPRLAIKIWSGWPTFPQVFVHGRLIGGCTDTERAIGDGALRRLLDAGR